MRLRAFVGGSDASTAQFTFAPLECVAGGGDAGHDRVAGCNHTARRACSGQVGGGKRQSVAPWIHLEPAAFIVPIVVIALWFLPRERVDVPRKAFWWTIAILTPLGWGLDFVLRTASSSSRVGRDAELARPALVAECR